MKAIARFRMDEHLLRQSWRDWVRHVSRWKRWSFLLSFVYIIGGIAMLCVWDSERRLIPLVLLLCGLFNLVYYFWSRRQWIKNARKSQDTVNEVEICFEDERIYMKSNFSKSESSWEVFQKAVATPSGLFLYFNRGIFIYIPDSSLEPQEAKSEILRRILQK